MRMRSRRLCDDPTSPSPTRAGSPGTRSSFTLRPVLALHDGLLRRLRLAQKHQRQRRATTGFFGWHFHAPFDTSEVKTVAVFFKSNVFRRDLQQSSPKP